MKFAFTLLVISMHPSIGFAQERGLDQVSNVSDANLICGKVNGKFIFFSKNNDKVWYIFSTPEDYKYFKRIKNSDDLEGLPAFEYKKRSNQDNLPALEKGGGFAEVQFRTEYGHNSSLLHVRKSSSGKSFRLFQGEDGTNGVCTFL